LGNILVFVKLLLVALFFLQKLRSQELLLLDELRLQRVLLSLGLHDNEPLLLDLVLELRYIGKIVHLVDHLHQIQDLVEILSRILLKRGVMSPLVLELDGLLLVLEECLLALGGNGGSFLFCLFDHVVGFEFFQLLL